MNWTRLLVFVSAVVMLTTTVAAQDASIPLPGQSSIPLPGEEPEAASSGGTPLPYTLPFTVRGYLENTTTTEYLEEDAREIWLHAGRARLDLAGTPGPGTDFGIGIVGTIHAGTKEIDLADYLPGEERERILPAAREIYRYRLKEDDLFLQEAFGTLYSDGFSLRVGRHKFYTGVGYAYNPIDLLNTKDPLDPTYETDGLDACLLRLNLPHQTELQGVIAYGEEEEFNYLARIRTHLRGWDLSMQYTAYLKERIDWEAVNTRDAIEQLGRGTSFDTFTRRFRWHLLAAEFSGELWEWGIYGEGGYVIIDEPDKVGTLSHAASDHERILLGLDHTFSSQLYLMAEYLRIGQGRARREEITLNDRMAFYSGEIVAIARDTIYAGLSYPLTDLLEFSLYAILGCSDGSGILNPWLLYDLRPGVKLSLSLNIPVGPDSGQNGAAGPSGFLRLKFHF